MDQTESVNKIIESFNVNEKKIFLYDNDNNVSGSWLTKDFIPIFTNGFRVDDYDKKNITGIKTIGNIKYNIYIYTLRDDINLGISAHNNDKFLLKDDIDNLFLDPNRFSKVKSARKV